MTSGRNLMRHERADMLLYCHEALHIQQKLQRSRYMQHAGRREVGLGFGLR